MSGILAIRRATPARALLWEFHRRGWWRILNAQIAAIGVAAIVYASLLRSGPLDPQSGRSLHFVLLWILFVASGGAALAAQGDPERLYRLPLSNWALSAGTLFPGMVCVAASYSITAGILNRWYGVGWPIWGPALFFAAALGAIQAATLSAGRGRITKFAVWCLVAVFFEGWLRGRYGGSFLQPKTMWPSVTLSEWLSMVLMIGVEFVVITHGIARERRGDRPVLSMTPVSPLFRTRKSVPDLPRLRTPSSAQFWFEWKQKGLILPGTFLTFAAFVFAGYVLNQFDKREYELLHCCIAYGSLLTPMALVAGLVLGHLDLPQANAQCGTFLATRPVKDGILSAAVLKAQAASLLLTWGLWTAAMIGTTAILYAVQGPVPVLDLWTDHGRFTPELESLGPWYPVLMFGLCLIAAWIPLMLGGCLALTGRQRLLMGSATGCVPAFLIMLYVAGAHAEGRVILPDYVWRILIGGTAALATAAAFATARRRELIGWSACGVALAGWLVLCSLAAVASWSIGSLSWASLAIAGVLALALAPLAAGPLALSWNRHR